MTRHRRAWLARPAALLCAIALAAVGCGSSDEPAHGGDRVIELPGAHRPTDVDDLTYAPGIGRLLVPARDAGLYLVEPNSGNVTRFDDLGSVASAVEGNGVIIVADRSSSRIAAIDPATGHLLGTARTRSAPDYVRHVTATNEIWVTEKGGDAGIEIFAGDPNERAGLRASGFIAIPQDPEGVTIAQDDGRAYSHSEDGDIVVIDIGRRRVIHRFPTGCDRIHGIPAVDEQHHAVLAGCADDGRGVLLDTDTGRRIADHSVGGGEALMAHGPNGHFYLRSDPGTTIAALAIAGDSELTVLSKVRAPGVGHCLTADDSGHYWTCDAQRGAVIRYSDG